METKIGDIKSKYDLFGEFVQGESRNPNCQYGFEQWDAFVECKLCHEKIKTLHPSSAIEMRIGGRNPVYAPLDDHIQLHKDLEALKLTQPKQ